MKIWRYTFLVTALLLVICFRAGIAEASCGTWSIVSSPNPPGDDTLFAVTAISAHDAWAVGSFNQQSPSPQTLTAHWNGTSWSLIPSPNHRPNIQQTARSNEHFFEQCLGGRIPSRQHWSCAGAHRTLEWHPMERCRQP